MKITISDDICMFCGKYIKKEEITMHHAIPQRYNPDSNVLCPLCSHCHKKVHSEDIQGLRGHFYRISKEIVGLLNKFLHLQNNNRKKVKRDGFRTDKNR